VRHDDYLVKCTYLFAQLDYSEPYNSNSPFASMNCLKLASCIGAYVTSFVLTWDDM